MATTISSGRANSPKLTANIADHGTIYGGRGLNFDGVTDYLNTSSNSLISGNNSWTMSAWINPDVDVPDTSNDYMTFIKQGTIGEDQMACFAIARVSSVNYLAYLGHTNDMYSSHVVPNNTWSHVVATYSSGTFASGGLKLYLNGEVDSSVPTAKYGDLTSSPNVGTSVMEIGKSQDGNSSYFNGQISDVKIFDTALTEAQVQELYLKPEQSAPSAVQDNLVAWFPMCEGNPDSPQSIVYDHSKKGLGGECVANGDFTGDASLWNQTDAKWSIDETNDYASYADGADGSLIQTDGNNLVSIGASKFYRIKFTISSGSSNAKVHWYSANVSQTLSAEATYADGNHTIYTTSPADYSGGVTVRGKNSGGTYNITNISIKEVFIGNHATTNFFGDDLVTNGTFGADSNWTKGTGWSIGSGVATCNGDQTDNTNLQQNDVVTVGKTYQITFDLTRTAGDFRLLVGSSSASGYYNTNATHTFTGVANGNAHLYLQGTTSFEGTVDNVVVKEVGISSSGFATADSEPTIPQVPLLRYNEKTIANRNYSQDVNLASTIDLPANSAFTVAFSYVGYSENENHALGGDGSNDSFRVDVGSAGQRVCLRIGGTSGWFSSLGSTIVVGGKNFFVITRTTAGALTVYNNGIAGSLSAGSATITNNFQISAIGGGNTYWFGDGVYDETSVWNYTMTATEVQELFNDGIPLDATTHSKADYLMGYWRNDGISSWIDRSDIQAISFDGTDDKIEIADGNYDFGTGDFSISMWANSTWSDDEMLIGKGSSNQVRGFMSTGGGSNIQVRWNLYKSPTELNIYTPTNGMNSFNGKWVHLVLTCDRDGNAIAYANAVAGSPVDMNSIGDLGSSQSLQLGSSNSSNYFNGLIGQTAIWHKVLSSSEISAIYALGRRDVDLTTSYSTDLKGYWLLNPTHSSPDVTGSNGVEDRSTNSNHGTQSGTVSFLGTNNGTPAGTPESIVVREGLNSNKDGLGFPFKNADKNVLRLSNNTEFVKLPYTKGLSATSIGDAITVECWIKFHNTSTGYNMIATNSTTGSWTNGWTLAMSNEEIRFTINHYNNNKATFSLSGTTTDWHHVVATYDRSLASDNIAIYVDLVKGTSDDLTEVIGESNQGVWIGDQSNESPIDTCLIDELKVYNRVLTGFKANGTAVADTETVASGEIAKNYKHGKGKHKND